MPLPVAREAALEDMCFSKPVRGEKGQTQQAVPLRRDYVQLQGWATWLLWLREGRGCSPLVSRGLGWAVQSRCPQGPGLLPAAVPLSWLNARHCVYAPGKRTGSYLCAGEQQRPVELVSWTLHPVIFVSICNQPAPVPMATANHKDVSEKGRFLTEYYCPQ